MKSRVQGHRVATEQVTGVRGPASRTRCSGGERTGDPQLGEGRDSKRGQMGRGGSAHAHSLEARPLGPLPAGALQERRKAPTPQEAGSCLGSTLSEPLLCLRSCPLPAATHRSPEKSPHRSRHLQCAQDSRDWRGGQGGSTGEGLGRSLGGGAGPGLERGRGWGRRLPELLAGLSSRQLTCWVRRPNSEEKIPPVASK